MTRIAKHYVRRGDVMLTATDREYEALHLVAAGLNLVEIGRIMDIDRRTVGTYIERWSSSAGVQNRTMLAVWALLTGLVTPADIWEIWETQVPELAAWQHAEMTP